MSRSRPIRLRESGTAAPQGAKIIDADFEEIGRRTIWDRVGLALIAIFWAAVIGFSIPQIWVFSQRVGEFFAAQ